MDFKVHDKKSAPEDARKLLEKAEENYGFVPNLLGVFAEAPAALEAYMTLMGIFDKSSFSETEKQVVFLTVSGENECGYCMAAHSALAKNTGMDDDTLEALREGNPLPDEKLDALSSFAAEVVTTNGNPSDDSVSSFLDAGYKNQQVLEVILGVAIKTLSNYTNHVAETPLDDAFEGTKWREENAA